MTNFSRPLRPVLLHFCLFARRDDFGVARVVLLHFCFFARRDDFGVARVVGQAGSLRPIVNRPNVANVQHSSFAACRYVGQVVKACGGLSIRLLQDATCLEPGALWVTDLLECVAPQIPAWLVAEMRHQRVDTGLHLRVSH